MGKLEKYIIISIVTTIILFLIWYFSTIVMYVLASFVLSLMGKPLMDKICNIKIKNRNIPRWIAATVVLILFFGIFFAAIKILVPVIYDNVSQYTNKHMDDLKIIVQQPINRLNDFIAGYVGDEFKLKDSDIVENISNRFSLIISNTIKNVSSIIDFIVSFVIASFSIFFITFFFLKEDKLFKNGLTMLFPIKYDKKINKALDSSINLLSKYFIALLMESTMKFMIITGGFVIFGIDFSTSIIIGAISAILNVIPYIGPLIGAVVGTMIAFAIYQGDIATLLIFSVAIFSIFQLIDNLIIQPYIYSTSVKAHPLEIFLIILLAGGFAGVLGMLFAIPFYTILRVFSKEFFNKLRVVRKLTESIDK